jgi:hypothetical protein
MEILAWPAVALILGLFALFMFKRNIAGRGLIAKGGDGFQVTLEGKEFMIWLVKTGRTYRRDN